MSTPTSPTNNPSQAYRKPRADIYTFMLVVALIAIIIACVCLYFEMERFDFKYKTAPKPPPAVAAAPQFPQAVAHRSENYRPDNLQIGEHGCSNDCWDT